MQKNLVNGSIAAFFLALWFAMSLSGTMNSWSPASAASFALMLATAFLWITEIVPLFITSFFVLLFELVWVQPLLKDMGSSVSKSAFLAPFFSDIILLFMGGFVLSDLLNRYGISRWIAVRMLGRSTGHPERTILMLMAVTAFFSMWISNTATAAMILALIAPLMAGEASHNAKRLLPLSVAFASNIGGLATPIGSPPNAIALSYMTKAGIHVSFFDWMLIMLPFLALMLLFIWKLLTKLYPIDAIPVDGLKSSNVAAMNFNTKQKIVTGIFLATVAGWVTTGLHPLSNGEVSIAMIITVFSLKLLKTEDFKNLPWNILIILGGGMALGIAVENSGLADNLLHIAPAEGNSLIAMLVGLSAVLSTFISNTATANLVAPLAVNLGDISFDVLLGVAIFCSTSMALAISTPPNVLAAAMGDLKAKDLFVPGVIISLASAVLFLPVLYYAKLILGI